MYLTQSVPLAPPVRDCLPTSNSEGTGKVSGTLSLSAD
jgi:hypothetical protein